MNRKRLQTFIGRYLAAILTVATAAGCSSVDDERIPPVNVNVQFNTIGDWQRYGVASAGQYREFIRQEKKPAGFNYTVAQYTGYGGLLLTCDPNGEYLVYDLSCPVEVKPDVRVYVDPEAELAGVARCPKCGSTYNLYGYGAPMSGEAFELKYGLQKYRITVGTQSIPYAYITR